MKPCPRSGIGFALAAALAFEAAFPLFADGAVPVFRSPAGAVPAASGSPDRPSVPSEGFPAWAASGFPSLDGLSESRLRAAFPDRPLRRMDPAAFDAFVRAHAGEGRFLDGVRLAAALDGSAPAHSAAPATAASVAAPGSRCDTLPPAARDRCRDSLARAPAGPPLPRALREMQAQEGASPDSQPFAAKEPHPSGPDQNLDQARAGEAEETKGWIANLIADIGECGHKDCKMDGHDWAAVIYVVVGVVVVGAFIIYGAETLAELILDQGQYPLFQEAGLRLSYSGHPWRDGAGADLYRDAYLAGLRYAIGFDRPGADVGLAVEGGYIDIRLRPLEGPGDAFDFRGGYLVAGPLLRFGSFDPACFSLEFLNGTSTHPSIGWISKARMALRFRMGKHESIGGDLGAVFYDLSFLDGLALRRGDLNRDLSLIGGFDFGWEF
jgi:hypothetical protein